MIRITSQGNDEKCYGVYIKETVLQTELFSQKFLCHSPTPTVMVSGDVIKVECGH